VRPLGSAINKLCCCVNTLECKIMEVVAGNDDKHLTPSTRVSLGNLRLFHHHMQRAANPYGIKD